MELKAAGGVPLFGITIRGYEFPDATAVGNDPFDLNWLNVVCRCVTVDVDRDYSWPCLTTREARSLADWLGRVAKQLPLTRAVIDVDDDDDVLVFIEPNLAFSVVEYPTDKSATVRVHVSFASLTAQGESARWHDLYGSHLDIEMDADALVDAASQWSHELIAYPVR